LHLVGILFPHNIDDARSKPHQINSTSNKLITSKPIFQSHEHYRRPSTPEASNNSHLRNAEVLQFPCTLKANPKLEALQEWETR
jgi:hypothetical protein